jgi:hypothetical protein
LLDENADGGKRPVRSRGVHGLHLWVASNTHTNTEADSDANPNAAYANADADSCSHTNSHTYGASVTNADSHTYSCSYSNADANSSYAHPDTDHHAYCNTDADSHTDTRMRVRRFLAVPPRTVVLRRITTR